VSRAFSACVCGNQFPGAMPQAESDIAPLAVNTIGSRRVFGKKRENTCLICFADSALGDQPGHEMSRRDVEAQIGSRTSLRRTVHFDVSSMQPAVGTSSLLRSASLRRNFVYAIAHPP